MARSVQEIEQEIRSLRITERNQLLRDLIADMGGESELDVEEVWLQESQRRHQELRDGLVEPVPAAEVIRKARLRLDSES